MVKNWGKDLCLNHCFYYLFLPNYNGEKQIITTIPNYSEASQVVLAMKNPPANAGDIRVTGPILGLERLPRRGHGNPLHYSCLENLMDRGAWWATVWSIGLQRVRYNWSDLAWNYESDEGSNFPYCFVVNTQHLDKCLVHNKCLIHISCIVWRMKRRAYCTEEHGALCRGFD